MTTVDIPGSDPIRGQFAVPSVRSMPTPCYYGALAADDFAGRDDRPPLVFLHGLGFDRRHWAPVTGELTAAVPSRRMISFDLPGHGDSPARDAITVLPDSGHFPHLARPAEVAGLLTDQRLETPGVNSSDGT